jgi:hypothetical protein
VVHTLPHRFSRPEVERQRARITHVVRAYRELEHEGVIELKHGSGAFIKESAGGRSRVIRKAQAVVQSAIDGACPWRRLQQVKPAVVATKTNASKAIVRPKGTRIVVWFFYWAQERAEVMPWEEVRPNPMVGPVSSGLTEPERRSTQEASPPGKACVFCERK